MSDYAAALAAAARDDMPAVLEIVHTSLEPPEVAELLRSLSRAPHHGLMCHAFSAYQAARTQEQREPALLLSVLRAMGTEVLDPYEVRAAVRAVTARDDLAARCEKFISHTDLVWTLLHLLPDAPRDRLLRHCAVRYAAAETKQWRDEVVALHAMLLAGRPDDTMAADRQRMLREYQERVLIPAKSFDLAWVELASGRDVPEPLGAEMRRLSYDLFSKRGYRVQGAVRALADHHPVLNAGEKWSDRALAELAESPDEWTELVAHAVTLTTLRPNAAWERRGRALLAEVDASEFQDRVLSWLSLIGGPPTLPRQRQFLFDSYNYVAARGLVWLLAFLPERTPTTRGLGTLLEKSLRKVPGVGPGMPKLANTCATALCRMEGAAALAELARLTTRVTYQTTLKLLRAELDARAQALGLSREEIEELAVPGYGLSERGRRLVRFGEATAELVLDTGRAVLHWRNVAGKEVRSVPAAVRREHPETLKELKAEAKDINTMLTAVAKRLERQFVTSRAWSSEVWRERYLDHPLVGTLARRLLWTLDGTPCGYSEGALRDLSGEPVTGAATGGVVRLWHPLGHPVEEVLAWQERLEDARVTQPFKQAHREVYPLTDAERRTRTYSNRFAGHVLGQYQFRSLAAERGWRDAELRIYHHEASYPPAVRELPDWGLRAEYWVRGEEGNGSVPVTESGAYELLAADQVRFYPIGAPSNEAGTMESQGFSMSGPWVPPLPLEEIPEQILSEVLRDVDLFVGVASVAHDPTWQDGGPDGHYATYWASHGFGELTETARTRHDLLTRMLPRLAVGDRCHVEGRFLHVKGTLHTYKIHLGSGNILMDPGDRYLCIVPKSVSASTSQVYLPFDGDRMLSFILSKALLLAEDTKITDPSIVSQL